jgi:hypothetical protein
VTAIWSLDAPAYFHATTFVDGGEPGTETNEMVVDHPADLRAG